LLASHTSLSWLESIGSNLAAGFLGSFITVLLIDRAITNERNQESQRVRVLALTQLRPFTLQQLELFCFWLKATLGRRPEKEPSGITELFSDEYYKELQRLDFSKHAPTAPSTTWFHFSAMVISKFRAELSSVLDKYAVFLDGKTLQLLEDLGNSEALGFLASSANWPSGSLQGAERRTYNVLAGVGMEDALRADLHRFLEFISELNRHILRPITIRDFSHVWRPDVGGPFGSARLTDEEFANSNPMIAIGRQLPPGGPLVA
jgi:hypothetical protein